MDASPDPVRAAHSLPMLRRLVLVLATLGASSPAAADPAREVPREVEPAEVRLAEAAAPRAASPWTRETPSGDRGGLREALAKRGVTLGLTWTSDAWGIVSGGVRHRAESVNDLDLTLAIDTEPLLGWPGGKLFLYGLGLWRTGSPSASAGDIQVLDDIDAPSQWRLYEAWVQQEVLGGRLSLRAGLYDVSAEFDAAETASLFLNSSFGTGKDFSQSGQNGPSIFPATSPGVRLDAQPLPHTYARVAVLDGVPGDPDAPVHSGLFSIDREQGVLGVAEVGYVAGDEGGEEPYTKLGLGGWAYSTGADRVGSTDAEGRPARKRGNFGMYLLGERAVYREAEDPKRGLAVFARVGLADAAVNPVGCYAGGGAVYTGLVPGRPDDRLGLGVAAAIPGRDFTRASENAGVPVHGAEVAVELTYRAQLTPWLSVQPDVQYIVDPGFAAGARNALAVGARIEVVY